MEKSKSTPDMQMKTAMQIIANSFFALADSESASPAFVGKSKLHKAVERGDVDTVRRLIAEGQNVNAIDENGWTPLHWAIIMGCTEIAPVLVEAGADINAKDNDGDTPLHHAATVGNTEVAQLLITAGAAVNAENEDNRRPLHMATKNGHSEVAQVLLDAEADVNAENEYGQTPLELAEEEEHQEIVDLLVEPKSMPDSKDIGFVYLATNKSMPDLVKIGMTKGKIAERMAELSINTSVPAAFECAFFCEVLNPARVEWLLHKQFSFCRESDKREFFRIDWRAVKAAMQMMAQADGMRLSDSDEVNKLAKVSKFALIKYIKEDNTDAVRQVLAAGGKPDQKDENRVTALMWAAVHPVNAEIVKILLEEGANPNLTSNTGSTALIRAALCEDCIGADIIKMLLEAGANINQKNKTGNTALHVVERAEFAQNLIDNGADIDAKNSADNTPLNLAAWRGHLEVAKVLIDAGADVNDEIKDGRTPTAIQSAREKGHHEMVELLRKHGAKD